MPGKPLDADYIKHLLSGKRGITAKPPKPPKPDDTPARIDYHETRPEWHKWVYGGQRNPLI